MTPPPENRTPQPPSDNATAPHPEVPKSPGPNHWSVDPSARPTIIDELHGVIDRLESDKAARGDLKILLRAIKELRYAFKVFTPYRRTRKVTVFGSARTPGDHPDYLASVELGRRFAEAGWMVVTGAGPGIMEGAMRGATPEMSMGVNIMLPFEQSANPVIHGDPKLVTFKYFFTRKLMFVKEVHAIVIFPGGFGTMDELFEVLTLVQTGKRDLLPIVLVDQPGGDYWEDGLSFIKEHLLARGLISPADLSLYTITDSVEDAYRQILKFYCVFNSMRYIRDQLVLRLHAAPSDELLERLNVDFADILEKGRIERTTAHAYESEDEHLKDLPRLAMYYNRRDSGRLRQLIDILNEEVDTPTGLCDKPELAPSPEADESSGGATPNSSVDS